MRIIKELSEAIKDEVHGVEKYAKMALEVRPTHPQLADKLYQIANTEYSHVTTLHDAVVKLAQEAKDKGNAPQDMINKWDEHHKEIVGKMQEAQTYLGMYKR